MGHWERASSARWRIWQGAWQAPRRCLGSNGRGGGVGMAVGTHRWLVCGGFRCGVAGGNAEARFGGGPKPRQAGAWRSQEGRLRSSFLVHHADVQGFLGGLFCARRGWLGMAVANRRHGGGARFIGFPLAQQAGRVFSMTGWKPIHRGVAGLLHPSIPLSNIPLSNIPLCLPPRFASLASRRPPSRFDG